MRRIKKRPVIGLDYKCHHFRRANDTCSVVTIFVKKHWGKPNFKRASRTDKLVSD